MPVRDIPFSKTEASEPEPPPVRDLFGSAETRNPAWRFHLFDRLTGGAVVGLDAVLRRLPLNWGPGLGAFLAGILRRLDRKRVYARRIAYNLAKLAPGGPLDGRALADLDAQWWRNAGMTKGEYSGVERYRAAGRLTLEGYETLTRMGLDKGQFIYVSVHLGSFEVLGDFVNNGLKRSCIGIWEPERNRFVNRLLSRLRLRYGMYVFPPGQRSARHIRRCVVDNGTDILCFVDEVRDRQSHLPTFGRPLPERCNAVNAVKLALRSGAPLVPIYMLREPGGRFRVRMHPPLPLDREAPVDEAVVKALGEIDRFFDPIVRANLEQWWMLSEVRLPGFVAHTGEARARDQ
jgi:KDO2-lipid IV(A) lauroyltransferase